MNLQQIFASAIDATIVLALLYLAKLVFDRLTVFDDDREIEERSNLAVAIRRLGLYLGLAIALTSALTGASGGLWNDITSLSIEGIVALGLMVVAFKINDWLLLNKINNDEQVLGDNQAVGLVEFGHAIATGLIMNGSLVGEGGGIISVMVWFAIGQIALLILAKAYEFIAGYNAMKEINEGNVAAGVSLAGMLIALGVILRFSLAGPFTGWEADLKSFGASLLVGMVMLWVFRIAIDWLFLPNTNFVKEIKSDKNVAALVMAQAVLISLSLIIGNAI